MGLLFCVVSLPSICQTVTDTVVQQRDELKEVLEKFHSDVSQISINRILNVKSSIDNFIKTLMPRIRENLHGINFDDPILSDSLYNGLKVIDIKHVEIILPIIAARTKWETNESMPGYVRLKLPYFKDETKWVNLQSRDFRYISLLRATHIIWKILKDCLINPWPIDGYEMLPLKTKIDGYVICVRNYRRRFIIKIYIGLKFGTNENCKLYTKPFDYDVDIASDSLWRITYIEHEIKITNALLTLVNIKHINAVRILLSLIRLDPMYKALNESQIYTVFMHTCDEESSYRVWNTKTLKECFYLLLRKLLNYLLVSNLPHFYIENLNLFSCLKDSDRNLIVGRIKFLLTYEKEVIRIFKRRISERKAISMDSSDDDNDSDD